MKIYIAGPMRGYPDFNFPAFDRAAQFVRFWGHEVVNPADLDREAGYDVADLQALTEEQLEAFSRRAILRDIQAILDGCDAISLLPGWEKSRGVAVEVALARFLGLQILNDALQPMDDEDILEEALRITSGDRNNAYGPPEQDFQRTARMWSALKGVEFDAKDVALFMIALKLSRATWMSKRDNWVDAAGYARCGWLCEQAAQASED